MLKSSLKTGMIIVTQDGGEYMVLRNVSYYGIHPHDLMDVCVSKDGWLRLSSYNDDLTIRERDYEKANELDIVAVYEPTQSSSLWRKCITDKYDWECIWKREEPPVEMTVAEIEEKLGIKNLKIIKEHDDE